MNTCTSIEPTSPVSTNVGTATSKFALRIVQPDRAEKTRPLALGKCMVGSSSRCHIRLVSPQARPLHCLIVHQGAETTVTRWSAGALLNGQEFTKATFRVGDCLQIGSVEVTLVLEEQPRIEHRNTAAPVEAADSEVAFVPVKQVAASLQVTNEVSPAKFSPAKSSLARYASDSLESDRLVRQLWSANYSARRRCRNLVHTLRSLRTEAGNLDQQLEMLREQLRKALDERKSIVDAETEKQQRVAELERWLGGRDEHIEHLQGELSQLRQLEETLRTRDQQIVELGEELGTLRRCRDELQSKLDDQKSTTEQLGSEVSALRSRCEAYSSSGDSREQQAVELQQVFSEQQNKFEQIQHQLEAANQQREEMKSTLAEWVAKCESLEIGKTELQDRCQQLEATHTSELERCQELESKIAQRQQSIMLFEADLQSVRSELQRTVDQNQQLQEKCGLAESQLADREELQLPERVVEPKRPADEQTSPDNFGPAQDHDAEAAIAHLKEMSVWRETENSPADAQEYQAPEEKTNQEDFTSASLIDNFSENLQADSHLEGEPARQLPGAYCESIIAGSEDEADDVALEAYMQNMMRRVRGESVSKEVSAEVPMSADNLAMLPETVIERNVSDVDLESEEPLSLESLKRSSRKPDLPTDLTAMRELANSSARRAIAKHSKGRYLEAAFTKFLISLIATGLAAMVLLTAEDYSSLRSIGGWVAGAMGAVWGFKMLGVLMEAFRAGSPQQIPTEIPVVDEPLPIDVVGASSSDDA